MSTSVEINTSVSNDTIVEPTAADVETVVLSDTGDSEVEKSVFERTWPEPITARKWLERNPQDGLDVKFDQSRAVYCLRPADLDDELPPDFAQEPVMTKKPTAVTKKAEAKAKMLAAVKAEAAEKRAAARAAKAGAVNGVQTNGAAELAPEPVVSAPSVLADAKPVEPSGIVEEPAVKTEVEPLPGVAEDLPSYRTVNLANARLVIAGLPETASAYTWALEMCRKLGQPILITDLAGGVLGTVDKQTLATVKAAKAAPKTPKGNGAVKADTGPSPMVQKALELATRKQGVTRGELAPLTPRQQPWTQILKEAASKYGYNFAVVDAESGRGGRVAYQLSK